MTEDARAQLKSRPRLVSSSERRPGALKWSPGGTPGVVVTSRGGSNINGQRYGDFMPFMI